MYNHIMTELVHALKINPVIAKHGIPAIMSFLLGDKCNDSQYISSKTDILAQSTLHGIYKGTHSLPQAAAYAVASSVDYGFMRIKECFFQHKESKYFSSDLPNTLSSKDKSDLEKAIFALYTKYFPHSSSNSDFSWSIKCLVSLYFFHTEYTEACFAPYTYRPVNGYIPLFDKEELLKNALYKERIVFITGNPGSGKKQFVKHFIATNDYNPYKVAWLPATASRSPLSENIKNLKFLCNANDILDVETIIETLEYADRSFVLIVDIPFMSEQDYDFIRECLSHLSLSIIIITRTIEIMDGFSVINLNGCPKNVLEKIFEEIYPTPYFTDQEYDTLFPIISYNPFVTSLIARTVKQNPDCLPRSSFLNTEEWIWNDKNLPKIHSLYKDNGKKSGYSITNFIHRLIDSELTKYIATDDLSRLTLWTKYAINEQDLLNHFKPEVIDLSKQYGIIEYMDSESKNLIMPALIADTIWDCYPINYNEYKEQILASVRLLQPGNKLPDSYQTLYNVTLNMIYRFHYNIITLKTRPTLDSLKVFKIWNELLTEITLLFIHLGNSKAASNLIYSLYKARDNKKNYRDMANPSQKNFRSSLKTFNKAND